MATKQETPSWVENAKQEARDRENQPKVDRAYEKSRTTPFKAGGNVSTSPPPPQQRSIPDDSEDIPF